MEAMLRHGARGTIFSRTQERLDKAAEQMRKDIPGCEVLAIAGDVRNPEDLEKAVKATAERFGKIDIVVAGAAGNFLAPIEHLSYRAFKTVIDIDLLGTFNVGMSWRSAARVGTPLNLLSSNTPQTIKSCYPYLKASGNASVIGVTATLHYNGTARIFSDSPSISQILADFYVPLSWFWFLFPPLPPTPQYTHIFNASGLAIASGGRQSWRRRTVPDRRSRMGSVRDQVEYCGSWTDCWDGGR